MTIWDEIRFHGERASAERECALSAATVPAARAHQALADLHADRVRALSGEVVEPLREPRPVVGA